MSLKARAPRAFRSPLRALLHARETYLTGPAGRGAGCGLGLGLGFACDSTRFPARAAWAPGRCPPDVLPARGRASDGLDRQRPPAPPALHQPAWAGAIPVAAGRNALAPRHDLLSCRGAPASLGCCQAIARQRLAGIMVRTVTRPYEWSQLDRCDYQPRRIESTIRRPSSLPVWRRTSPKPTRKQGPWHLVLPLHPVPGGCGFVVTLALWPCGLGFRYATGNELRKDGGNSKRSTLRQAGTAEVGSESRNPVS